MIVADGEVLERNLRRQRMTVEEVRFAVLETNGKISFATK